MSKEKWATQQILEQFSQFTNGAREFYNDQLSQIDIAQDAFAASLSQKIDTEFPRRFKILKKSPELKRSMADSIAIVKAHRQLYSAEEQKYGSHSIV